MKVKEIMVSFETWLALPVDRVEYKRKVSYKEKELQKYEQEPPCVFGCVQSVYAQDETLTRSVNSLGNGN